MSKEKKLCLIFVFDFNSCFVGVTNMFYCYGSYLLHICQHTF